MFTSALRIASCVMLAMSVIGAVPRLAHAGGPTAALPVVDDPTPTPSATATATFTPTSCVSDPPLVNPVTSPTDQLQQTITGYSRGLLCPRGGSIGVTGVEVLSQSQNCTQGTFEVTVRLQPDRANDFMVCLRPGMCGAGGCTAVEIVHASSVPTSTATATPSPTPTACPDCVLLGFLSVSGPTVDPPRPAVGAQVTLTFPVSAALPGGFDCEHCVFEGGEGYLAGEDPPVEVGDNVVVQRRVVRAGSTTVQLHARETTEEQCYYADPVQGCVMFFQYAFIEASSPPFVLQLGEIFCAGDCDGNGETTVEEVVVLVNIALGETALSACPAGDHSGDNQITIDELIGAVASVLGGCPSAPAFAVRGTVTEFPDCAGFMRGITVVLDPLGLTTQTAIGPDPGVAGTFAFDDVPPGDYTLTISPSCNPYGCWPPTPVRVVDRDVKVLICNSAACGDQEVMDRFPSCIAAGTEAACLAAGGVWTQIGIRPEPECVCPTGQDGCACNRSTDCLGACTATLAGVPGDCSTVQGFCAGQAPIVGCRCWFDERGDAQPLCVD